MRGYRLRHQAIASFKQISDSSIAEGDGGEYIFDVEYSCDASKLVASVSDMHVHIYDSESLRFLSKVPVHDEKINCIETSRTFSDVFCTGSDDHTVKIWDMRSIQTPVGLYKFNSEVCGVSCGMDGWLLAVGCGTTINFYDLRMQSNAIQNGSRKLGEYSDIHTDIITQLKFHPLQNSLLTSAAEDGLICVFNTAVAEEEEAVVSILNTECPVRRYGFFGDNLEGLYSLSTIETASIWHFNSAQRISNFPSIREEFGVDYLVDCIYNPIQDSLSMIVGKYDGSGSKLNISPDRIEQVANFSGGHSATIRCAIQFSATTSTSADSAIITGGEDARLCCWEPSSVVESGNSSSLVVNSSHVPRNRQSAAGQAFSGSSKGRKDQTRYQNPY